MGGVSGCWIYSAINQNIEKACDGTKTSAQVLNELYEEYITRATSLASNERMEITGIYAPLVGEMSANRYGIYASNTSYLVATIFSCTYFAASNNTILTGCVRFQRNASEFKALKKNSTSDEVLNYTQEVFPSSNKFILRYSIIRQI